MDSRSRPGPPVPTEGSSELPPPAESPGSPTSSRIGGDLEAQVQRFADAARRFSDDFVAVGGDEFPRDPFRSAMRNVELAKALFGKWVVEILLMIYGLKEVGFQDLRRGLEKISPRVLSMKLRRLEERQLVQRTVLATRPTRVRYSLTRDGLLLAKLAEPVFLFLRLRYPPGVSEPGVVPVAERPAATLPAPEEPAPTP